MIRLPKFVPELRSQGLLLRDLVEADIPAWFERATDAESADLAGDPVPDSIAEGGPWLQRHRDRFRNGRGIRWAIVPAGAATSVGTIGLSFPAARDGTAELSVVVARRHWRQGVASSALSLVTQYAFEHLGVAQLSAEVLQRNAASIRLLEKCGFRRIRVNPPTEDEPEELVLYSLSMT